MKRSRISQVRAGLGRSDGITLLLAAAAIGVVVAAWRNSRMSSTPQGELVAPLAEWPEIKRVASWLPSTAGSVDDTGTIVFIVQAGCARCADLFAWIRLAREQQGGGSPRIGFLNHYEPAQLGQRDAAIRFECSVQSGVVPFLDSPPTRTMRPSSAQGTPSRDLAAARCVRDDATGAIVDRQFAAVRQMGLTVFPAAVLRGRLFTGDLGRLRIDSLLHPFR